MAHGRQSVRWLITVTTAHFGIILLRCFVVPVTIIRCCLPSIAFIPTYGIPCLSCFMHRSRNTIQSKFDRAFPRTSRFPFCIPFRFDVSLGPRLRRLCLLRSDDTILHCSFSSLFPFVYTCLARLAGRGHQLRRSWQVPSQLIDLHRSRVRG